MLVDLKPTGDGYMEDLHKAGGLRTMLSELKPALHLDCLTVTGRTLGDEIAGAPPAFAQDVRQAVGRSLSTETAAMARAEGQPRAARRHHQTMRRQPCLFCNTPARRSCFDSLADLGERIDDPDLDVTPETVLVLRNAGPKGGARACRKRATCRFRRSLRGRA